MLIFNIILALGSKIMRLNLTAILYSNKNIDLAYKSKKSCRKMQINLINSTDFVDLTIKIVELKPEIVMFDLTTTNLQKEIIRLFVSEVQYHVPNVILIYNNKEQLEQYAEFNLCSIKADELDMLLIKEEKNLKLRSINFEHNKKNMADISKIINNHLFSMGFSAKHTGYSYLTEVIKLAIKKNGHIGSLSNEVYPIIAAKYGTIVFNVERNIRNAINCAFTAYSIDNCSTVKCDNFFNYFKTRPTNREFICTYIERMQDYLNSEENNLLINNK